MRRTLFMLLFATLLPAPAAAMEWAVGLQAIGSSHSLSGDLPDEGDWKGEFGGGAGLMFDLSVSRDVTLSFQPAWVRRGCTQLFEEKGVVVAEENFDFEYLVLPLVIRVDSDPRRFQGFVTAGLSLSYLLDAQLEGALGVFDVADRFNDLTAGALFGAGMFVRVGKQKLSLELRYEQGLDDILNRGGLAPFESRSTPSTKYREFKLVAGLLFGPGVRR